MGRKKLENSPKYYFDEPEEQAVREFLTGDPANRDKVFKDVLYQPLLKMIESLIKRYKKMRADISIEDLITDTLSHVVSKFHKFQETKKVMDENGNIVEKKYKAYSYFGTVAHNYLKGQLNLSNKNKIRNLSYEDISSDIEENMKYMYEMDFEEKVETFDFIQILIDKLEEEIKVNEKLKPNDIKVGKSVIDLLKNWENFIDPEDQSNMLNRNKILYYIRETSFLTPKEVRNSLKKFKVLYQLIKSDVYE